MRRVICIKSKEPNMDETVYRQTHAEFLRVIDICGYEYNPVDRNYYLTLLVDEKMVDIKQGFTGFLSDKVETLVKDINDYCGVMDESHKICFEIQQVKIFRVRQGDGRTLWVGYLVYNE
ncbi:MAG: hypothetical protein ACM3NT_05795 [Methylocystaceae bacterium]